MERDRHKEEGRRGDSIHEPQDAKGESFMERSIDRGGER